MNIILDDWLVIIETKDTKRIFNTEMWVEWGNVGVVFDVSESEKHYAEIKVIERALQTFYIEKEQ